MSDRPIEPTEILPREGSPSSDASPGELAPRSASASSLRALVSASAVTSVVAGGAVAAAAVGGARAVAGVARFLQRGVRSGGPGAGGDLIRYSAGTIGTAGFRIDWASIEVHTRSSRG